MQQAIHYLSEKDPIFKTIVEKYGLPVIPVRPQGFETVVLLILESVIFTLSFSTAYYLIYYRPFHHSFQNSLELLNEFETVLRTTSDGFWITDIEHNGRILFVNDAYCEMIGYTRQELLQMNIRDIDCNE